MSDPTTLVADVFAAHNVPEYIWKAIMEAESSGNPLALGDNGNSVGLFQLNTVGGQGAGYTPALLQDPIINASIAVNSISDAWDVVKYMGLSPSDEAKQVAIRSGHPGGSVDRPATDLLNNSLVTRIGAYASEFSTGTGASESAEADSMNYITIGGIKIPTVQGLLAKVPGYSTLAGAGAATDAINGWIAQLNKADWVDIAIRSALVGLGGIVAILMIVLIASEAGMKVAEPIAKEAIRAKAAL